MKHFLLLSFLSLSSLGCGKRIQSTTSSVDKSESSPLPNKSAQEINLSGEWWGGRGNEDLPYMKLAHKKGQITGAICDQPDHDCLEIKTSVLSDNELTLKVQSEQMKHDNYVISVVLTYSSENNKQTLIGKGTLYQEHINADGSNTLHEKHVYRNLSFTDRTSNDTSKELRQKHPTSNVRERGAEKPSDLGVINLSGEWWGGRGNEDLAYMKLVHEEGKVTGSLCERPDHDCFEIKSPVLNDNELTFKLGFEKRDHSKYVFDAVLTYSSENKKQTLTGKGIIYEEHVNADGSSTLHEKHVFDNFSFIERTSNDKCEELRQKHPTLNLRELGVEKLSDLGIVKLKQDGYSYLTELTEQSTTENMYVIGYLWSCTEIPNWRSFDTPIQPLPEEWTYSQNQNHYLYLLGYPANSDERQKFTEMVKAYRQGYVQSFLDRGF